MLYEKIHALEEALSLDYINFDIEIGKKKFSFHPPLDKKDARRLAKMRKQLIYLLMKDAAAQMVEEAMIDYYDCELSLTCDSESNIWKYVDKIIHNIEPREEVASPIDASTIQQIKDDAASGKQIGLNYDSYQVKMQDPSLEIENA